MPQPQHYESVICRCAGCGHEINKHAGLDQVYREGRPGLCPECTMEARDMGVTPAYYMRVVGGVS